MLSAGFAEVDITPPVGTEKIGWIIKNVGLRVVDPLFARIAVFDTGNSAIGFIQLDTLCIRWSTVNEMRRRVEARFGFPGDHIMVSATHNHAGPAVAGGGWTTREDAYVETLTEQCVTTFGKALENRQPAEIGFGHTFEWGISHNRRVVMRDGTARTHGTFNDPDALYLEGPIDPTVSVLAVRKPGGDLLGCLVNFTCHPTHHGGDDAFCGGFPGILAAEMKGKGCPVTLYLNGACGNVHTSDPTHGNAGMDYVDAGQLLAQDVERVLTGLEYHADAELGARSRTIQLPYRTITDDEIRGTVRGAQRFVDPNCYDDCMPRLVDRIRTRGTQPAEVQVLSIDDIDVVGIPAEYFVEHGLRIKTSTYPRRALISATTNGMVGYIPTAAAFTRGGYETTFGEGSRQAPEAGDLLADAAIGLVNGIQTGCKNG